MFCFCFVFINGAYGKKFEGYIFVSIMYTCSDKCLTSTAWPRAAHNYVNERNIYTIGKNYSITIVFNDDRSQYSRLAEFDEILVGGPRWQASNVQVGLTQLLRPSLAAAVGAGAGRSHGMRGWSIGLLEREGKEKAS